MPEKSYKCRFYIGTAYFEMTIDSPLKEFYFFPIHSKRCNKTAKFVYSFSVLQGKTILVCVFRQARKHE